MMSFFIKTLFFILFISIVLISCKKDVIRTYYPNGNIEMEIEVKNDVSNGVHKYLYESGNIKEVGYHIEGKAVDSSNVFYDMPIKKLKRIKYWNNDTLFYVKEFDTLGRMTREGSASAKGEKLGLWKIYPNFN